MYTYVFMTSVRVIPVSAVLSRVPYEWLYLQKWVTPPLSRTEPRCATDYMYNLVHIRPYMCSPACVVVRVLDL